MAASKNKTTEPKDPALIEVTPVRLTAEETRAIVRLSRLDDRPLISTGWQTTYRDLLALGIAQESVIPKDPAAEQKAWTALKSASAAKDLERCATSLKELRDLQNAKDQVGYSLTKFGKEVALGVAVRLGPR